MLFSLALTVLTSSGDGSDAAPVSVTLLFWIVFGSVFATMVTIVLIEALWHIHIARRELREQERIVRKEREEEQAKEKNRGDE